MRRLALLALLLLACGAPDEEGHVDDVKLRYDHFLGTFDYGQTPPELIGDPRVERLLRGEGPIDKTFAGRKYLGGIQSERVYAPNRYGARAGSSQAYCTADPAGWSSSCYVAYSRWARIKYDFASCSAVHSNIRAAIIAGYNRFASEATLSWGWDVTNAAADEADFITLKCMPWSEPSGDAPVDIWFCWDLDSLGYPRDLCFLKPGTHEARIGASAIQAQYGTGTAGQTYANNLVMHELMHTLAVGHFGSGDPFNSIMWPYITPNFLQQPNATQNQMMRDYLHDFGSFQASVYRCNWSPGQPVGSTCPSKVAVPFQDL